MKAAPLASLLIFCLPTFARADDTQAATSSTEIRAGREAMDDGRPDQAHDLFTAALAHSEISREDQFAALVGLARSELWLEDYMAASDAFRRAQAVANSPSDRRAADIGLAKALNAREYYMQAYALAAPYASGGIDASIEVLRAEQALEWDDRSLPIMGAASRVDSNSRLGVEYLHLKSETDYQLSDRATGAFSYSHDSDNLTVFGFELNARLPGTVGGEIFNDWMLSTKTFTVGDGKSTNQLTYVGGGTRMRIGDEHRVALDVGVNTFDGWTFFQGAAAWEYRLNDSLSVNAAAERSPIVTTTALSEHVLFNTYTLGTNLRLTDHIFLIPAYTHQDFSRNNHRDGASLRLEFTPYDLSGSSSALGAQIYTRMFNSSLPTTGIYFNPRTYDLAKFDFIAVHRFSPDWLLRAIVGGGYETSNGSGGSSYEIEVSLAGRLPGNGRLAATLGRSSFASLTGGSTGYWENNVIFSLSYPFG